MGSCKYEKSLKTGQRMEDIPTHSSFSIRYKYGSTSEITESYPLLTKNLKTQKTMKTDLSKKVTSSVKNVSSSLRNNKADNMSPELFIGVDAPKGIALWSGVNQKFYRISTVDFWTIIQVIQDNFELYGTKLLVVVEDPAVNKPTFIRHGLGQNRMKKIAQNVGMNKQCATLIIKFCNIHNIPCKPAAPLRGLLKKWKNDIDMFKSMTGYEGSTSEHGRDSSALVFGMK